MIISPKIAKYIEGSLIRRKTDAPASITLYFYLWGVYFFVKYLGKHLEEKREAYHEAHLLRLWIIKHLNDPLMSDLKWQELTPICRFADERVREICGTYSKVESCEDLLKWAMGSDDEEEPEETSA